jgi:hypothetical protein
MVFGLEHSRQTRLSVSIRPGKTKGSSSLTSLSTMAGAVAKPCSGWAAETAADRRYRSQNRRMPARTKSVSDQAKFVDLLLLQHRRAFGRAIGQLRGFVARLIGQARNPIGDGRTHRDVAAAVDRIGERLG